MGLPKLYIKGVLEPTNKKIKKEKLDQYIAIHFILNLIDFKLNQEQPNMHDKLLMLKSLTGTGKSTALIVEVFRRFLGKKYSAFSGEVKETKIMYSTPIDDFDFSIFKFKDDKYTTANKKEGFPVMNRKKNIIFCTQPKVLTAKSKSIEIATEPYNPDLELGENVGYSTGVSKQFANNNDQIMYATLGTFTMLMKHRTDQEICESYKIIFIDECHIRSVDLDLSMLYIKEFLRRQAGNPMCPLFVFMSATFDTDKYADYMETPRENSIVVKGGVSTYTLTYTDKPVRDYIQAAVDLAWKIHTENINDKPEEADILIFVPDGMIGSDISRRLRKLDTKKELMLYDLSGETVKKGGDAVAKIETWHLDEVKKAEGISSLIRRVTVSTSVAETGITIGALKYEIDCGFDKGTGYIPLHKLKYLKTGPVTRSAAEQRHGRVGRTFPGQAFGLYTKKDFENLEEYSFPDTYNDDISKNVLDMMYAKIPPGCIDNQGDFSKLTGFTEHCLNALDVKSEKKNLNCFNMYLDAGINGSDVKTVDDYLCEGEVFKPIPEHLLDDIPQDSFLQSRNKLLMLGLLGTYSGYLASKLPSYSNVEGARMMLACSAYGVSTSDAITMAVLGSRSRNDYIISDGAANFHRKPKFDLYKIIKRVISEKNIQKYCFGSVKNFTEMIQDDFIEGLIIMKYISIAMREFKKSKAKNRFAYTIKECENVGLNVTGLGYFLADRMTMTNSARDIGIINNYPNTDFNSPDLINQIMRLKKCILAGYKCNVAIFDEQKKAYVTTSGLPIKTHIIRSNRAKKIVYSSLFMKQNRKAISYSATAELTSSMDGIF